MTRIPEPNREGQLDRRMARILRFVVEQFAGAGVPVGSRTLSKMEGEHLSPASIRNAMSDLEEMGYLHQPHVSAGRVPTDKGYRYYVDTLMEQPTLPLAELEEIEGFFRSYRGMVGSILERSTRVLSHFSHYIGIASLPHFENTVFSHIEFISQGPGKVLAVFVSRSGLVHNKQIEVEGDYSQDELHRISNWVVDHFSGLTLFELRKKVDEMLQEERARVDRLRRSALLFSQAALAESFGGEEIYIEGASNIVGETDFADVEKIQELMRAVEEKSLLIELLNRCMSGEGVQIVIGSEAELQEISGCSLVASAYTFPDGSKGSVAVLGPKRMPYPRTIFLVDFISRKITRLMD